MGTALLLFFIPLYALLAVRIAVAHVPEGAILAQTVYFAIAGLAWIFPAGLIIRWMLRPDPGAPA
ncbi:MAG TPA: DUF2842 domain-containing protein [Bauldia sp.]|nr:DUF2842 domain-containing protein [Bauldia sp.]